MTPPRDSGNCSRLAIDGQQLDCRSLPAIDEPVPAVVLLHEGLGCVATWRDFAQRLNTASGACVFAYSTAGHGKSTLDAICRWLATTVD